MLFQFFINYFVMSVMICVKGRFYTLCTHFTVFGRVAGFEPLYLGVLPLSYTPFINLVAACSARLIPNTEELYQIVKVQPPQP